ncbi:hypothetical protein OPV22_007114 [Ensete ventricosum]|uniref:C2 NT-type domain-containing protein n=1 Tax=Ensete ventricosum TaxID=4639 RepID=A0AAV8RR32_ENSVE|nr:hypothetical protein OPV22_007114 [Ensete ventricosum]RWW25422.1 hypothetical protein GW17_00010236 [Ensete ventricosum]RWW66522.1 hypothetical protein BHE74_00026108 [Ensete ventricosum]RZS29066.1 hypothetical protein BHM03_00062736 [Ensete ventricosum]
MSGSPPSPKAEANMQIVPELESQSRSVCRAHSSRRTASLVLPCFSSATPPVDDEPRLVGEAARSDRHNHSSSHPFCGKSRQDHEGDNTDGGRHHTPVGEPGPEEKRGIWSWKPIRALARITMHRLVCLFSVEVIAIHHLPDSVDGLRLSVVVRKKETRDGAVKTMPSRALQGTADFQETLFIPSHLYCSGGAGTGKPLKFESRLFLISTVAVDAPQLDLGTSIVDLSSMVKESIQKNLEGQRIRQWGKDFPLSGKAKGGEMGLKLAFQIMDDGGFGIYNQAETIGTNREKDPDFVVSWKQPRSSFSDANPRTMIEPPSLIPSDDNTSMKRSAATDELAHEGHGFNPSVSPVLQKTKSDLVEEADDLPSYEVIDKGIEIQEEKQNEEEEMTSGATTKGASVSSEVVKQVVHRRAQQRRLKELRPVTRKFEALDFVVTEDVVGLAKTTQEHKLQRLDTDEETVIKEFLRLLEFEASEESKCDVSLITCSNLGSKEDARNEEETVLLSDLGKNLGPVVQTRDGGYLASMNPYNVPVSRKETPKLAMQISRELILEEKNLESEFEVFRSLAAMGSEKMSSKILSLAAMDELFGKTAGQIAIEGVASAIISGRNKEGASSSAARTITTVKKMAAAMNEGRKERISTGIWSANEKPVAVDEILTLSLQKMEAMAVDALKIQVEMTEEEAHFDAAPPMESNDSGNPLESTISPEDWSKACSAKDNVMMLVVIQLRDPSRSYEAVGAPMIVVVKAVASDDGQGNNDRRFKLTSLHVGGLRLSSNRNRSVGDGEKQISTAMQWLAENGLAKAGRRTKRTKAKKGQDVVWSVSSRCSAGLWLVPVRNPNVKVLSNNL